MKTIIGFDSWTAGSRHFERLAPEFRKKGYRLLLIHIGSWGHDKDRPKEETFGELQVRDISDYKKATFKTILDIEHPSAVLFLSTRAFAHMAFNRYANYLAIPTCHLYHGLVKVQPVNPGQRVSETNYLQHVKLLSDRIWKNIFRLVPCYLRALVFTSAHPQAWIDLCALLYTKAFGDRREKLQLDAQTSCGCVYVRADVEHMVRNYGIDIHKVHVVGNPDIAMFELQPADLCAALVSCNDRKLDIIYIDTAFSKTGAVFSSDTDFIRHLTDTRSALELQGYKLVVKLHPAHYQKGTVPRDLIEHGFELCTNSDFTRRIKCASAAIVEPSSAAAIPALFGLPVLLAQYGKLSGQQYGEVLTTYPRARVVDRIDNITTILSEVQEPTVDCQVKKWIDENAGPLPAEDMPQRVVEVIDQMVREHENLCAVQPALKKFTPI